MMSLVIGALAAAVFALTVAVAKVVIVLGAQVTIGKLDARFLPTISNAYVFMWAARIWAGVALCVAVWQLL